MLTSPSLQVSLNAWFWSTVFHTKDTDLTEVSTPSAPLLLGTVPQEPRRGGGQLFGFIGTPFTEHSLCARHF